MRESVTVTTPESGFLHVHHVQIEDSGVDMGGPLWLEQGSLAWVIEALRECIETYASPGSEATVGSDQLKVFESGPEPAPIINLRNRRAADAKHGGVYALLMSKRIAEQLLGELRALI